jgi:hypothetical protein
MKVVITNVPKRSFVFGSNVEKTFTFFSGCGYAVNATQKYSQKVSFVTNSSV